MRKNEFQRLYGLELKRELIKHKEKIENIYRVKLDDEKRKVMRQKVGEVDDLVKENKRLKEDILKIREALQERSK